MYWNIPITMSIDLSIYDLSPIEYFQLPPEVPPAPPILPTELARVRKYIDRWLLLHTQCRLVVTPRDVFRLAYLDEKIRNVVADLTQYTLDRIIISTIHPLTLLGKIRRRSPDLYKSLFAYYVIKKEIYTQNTIMYPIVYDIQY